MGEVPRTGVLVGALHTSTWDFVMVLLIIWRGGVTPLLILAADMDQVRRSDRDKCGIHPKRRTEPLLREERAPASP
ncbi:MAG: hypothetical protein ABIU87_09205 [Ornithinibacter sp.]